MVEQDWFKSTSSTDNGTSVETARQPAGMAVRDSKDSDGPVLIFGRGSWLEFLAGVTAGEFDREDPTR